MEKKTVKIISTELSEKFNAPSESYSFGCYRNVTKLIR